MIEVCLAASFGAFLQELLHWAEQRNRLKVVDFQALVRNHGYWVIIAILIPATGIASYFWYSNQSVPPPLRDALIFGAALPALFKKGVGAASRRTLGAMKTNTGQKTLKQLYLGI